MNNPAFTQIAKVLGLLALAGTIVPPVLFLTKTLALEPMKFIMLIAMVVWFVTAPLWMKGGDH
jgi:hypothetical protein